MTFFFFVFIMAAKGQPIIKSFTPLSGPIGTTVSIVGKNFNNDTASNVVFFGATRASVINASDTELVVLVPLGATYQPISIINTGTNLIGNSNRYFEVTYNSGIGQVITNTSFNPKVDFATGNNPAGNIAVADIDGDGKPDMIVLNRSTNTFSILQNTSAAGVINKTTFATKVDFVTDSTPSFVVAGDIDCDGKQDVVIVNMFTNKIAVYRNTSSLGAITTASLAAKVNFISDTLAMPTSVAIGDLDGDGKPELVVTNSFNNTVSILKNTSHVGLIDSTSFAPSVDFTSGLGPVSVAIADINGDGKPDLVVSDFDAKTISVFKNTTTLNNITRTSFASKVDFKVGTCPNALTVGDLNGDGKQDVIVVNQTNSTISILANTCKLSAIDSSSFASQVVLPTNGLSPYYVTVGNIDSDSLPDIVVANLISNNISIIKNIYSSGSINVSSFSAGVNLSTGFYPFSVSIADFDGDNKPDLAVPVYGANTVSVYQNLFANILPVSFVSFNGRYLSGKALLNWQVSSDLDVAAYVVERSCNGIDFAEVGLVTVSASKVDYTFKDELPLVNSISSIYYRLKAVDYNGSKTYSNSILITCEKLNSYVIYPNPAKSILNIKANNDVFGNGIFLITDLNGHAILSNHLEDKRVQQIEIGNLAKGIYNVTIFTASGKQTQQIVLE